MRLKYGPYIRHLCLNGATSASSGTPFASTFPGSVRAQPPRREREICRPTGTRRCRAARPASSRGAPRASRAAPSSSRTARASRCASARRARACAHARRELCAREGARTRRRALAPRPAGARPARVHRAQPLAPAPVRRGCSADAAERAARRRRDRLAAAPGQVPRPLEEGVVRAQAALPLPVRLGPRGQAQGEGGARGKEADLRPWPGHEWQRPSP